jgi:hypothetical protein
VDQLLMQLYRDEPDLDAITRFHLRLLPLDLRLRQWARLGMGNGAFMPGLLLPEWLGVALEKRVLKRQAA